LSLASDHVRILSAAFVFKMKKSDKLFVEAEQEENDFRYWSKIYDAEREKRKENFEDNFLPTIKNSPHVLSIEERMSGSMLMIEFSDGVKIDYYPKKDRVFIKKLCHWKSYGKTWILNKISTAK